MEEADFSLKKMTTSKLCTSVSTPKNDIVASLSMTHLYSIEKMQKLTKLTQQTTCNREDENEKKLIRNYEATTRKETREPTQSYDAHQWAESPA